MNEKKEHMSTERITDLLATLYTAYRFKGMIGNQEEQEILSLVGSQLEQSGLIWKDKTGKWHLQRSQEEWSEIRKQFSRSPREARSHRETVRLWAKRPAPGRVSVPA